MGDTLKEVSWQSFMTQEEVHLLPESNSETPTSMEAPKNTLLPAKECTLASSSTAVSRPMSTLETSFQSTRFQKVQLSATLNTNTLIEELSPELVELLLPLLVTVMMVPKPVSVFLLDKEKPLLVDVEL